jgi:hypothetical protein
VKTRQTGACATGYQGEFRIDRIFSTLFGATAAREISHSHLRPVFFFVLFAAA